MLEPDGGIVAMVYARHGRESLHLFQELLRYLAPPELGRVVDEVDASLPR